MREGGYYRCRGEAGRSGEEHEGRSRSDFSAARVQRIQESGRHGGSKGGLEEGITDSEG